MFPLYPSDPLNVEGKKYMNILNMGSHHAINVKINMFEAVKHDTKVWIVRALICEYFIEVMFNINYQIWISFC